MDKIEYDLPDPELLIPLDPPVRRKDGGEVTEITLREPTAAEVRKAETFLRQSVNPASLREYQVSLVTSVCGMAREVVEAMPVSKFTEAADYLQNFITPGPKTGRS